jgi:hypothetical protein
MSAFEGKAGITFLEGKKNWVDVTPGVTPKGIPGARRLEVAA